MTMKKEKSKNLSKQRVQPVILKGNEKNWNKINKKENDVKLSIDKSIKKDNFQLTKENEILIENDTEEILVNDDYNIVLKIRNLTGKNEWIGDWSDYSGLWNDSFKNILNYNSGEKSFYMNFLNHIQII